MVFCQFCHWTKVEPGTNCPRCNTYAPAAAPASRHEARGHRRERVAPVVGRRRAVTRHAGRPGEQVEAV